MPKFLAGASIECDQVAVLPSSKQHPTRRTEDPSRGRADLQRELPALRPCQWVESPYEARSAAFHVHLRSTTCERFTRLRNLDLADVECASFTHSDIEQAS